MLNLYHAAIAVGLDDDRVYLHQTPMFHAASMTGVLGIPASGGVSVFVPYFNPAAVLDAIERYRVNITLMVPIMVGMLLDAPEFEPERLTTLESLVYGAAPMPTGLLEHLLSTFPQLDLYQGYGMTEASAVLTLLNAKDHRRGGDALRSAGRPVYGVEISVRGEDDHEVPVGQTGEVCARSGNFMREYWKRPEETAAAFRDGWYHSGDTGYLDEQGFLFIVDRLKDMIVTGGENVYSIEVENAISTHPAVDQVAVIGIPDDLWGEAVHAIVVLEPGAHATAAELTQHARQTIAGYKLPKSISFRADPLPLSGALEAAEAGVARALLGRPRAGCVSIERASDPSEGVCQRRAAVHPARVSDGCARRSPMSRLHRYIYAAHRIYWSHGEAFGGHRRRRPERSPRTARNRDDQGNGQPGAPARGPDAVEDGNGGARSAGPRRPRSA